MRAGARRLVAAWRGRKPGVASVAGEPFVLRYPFSRFDPGPEQVVLDAFAGSLRAGMRVYDIGANAGIYTVLAARRGASVVAFEPSEEAVALLRDHLALNDLDAEVVEAVVADEEGRITFFEQGSATTSSLSEASARTGEAFLDDPVVATTRPAVTIDGFSRSAGRWPDLIKLDVEGAELLALRGAGEWLARRRGLLLLEVHPWSLGQLGAAPDDVFALLRDAGWRAELLEDNGNTSHHRVVPA